MISPRAAPEENKEIGILLPNNQCQHRTLHIQKDVLPYAVPRVSRSYENFPDGFDGHLPQGEENFKGSSPESQGQNLALTI